MQSDSAVERVERILDLIPFLVGKETRIADLAAELNVSQEVIRRDLEIAFLCGLPGYTPDLLIDMDLDEETVTVLQPQALEGPRRLSAEEVSLLVLGLELITISYAHSPAVEREIRSLKAKLNSAPLDSMVSSSEDGIRENQGKIEEAILKERDLSFDYLDSVGKRSTSRRVMPLRTSWRGGEPVLEAFDHDKGAHRVFIISRISSIETLDRTSPVRHLTPDNEQPREATLLFSSLPRWWVRRHNVFIKGVTEDSGHVLVELEYWKESWLVMAVASVADRFLSLTDTSLDQTTFEALLLSHLSETETARER